MLIIKIKNFRLSVKITIGAIISLAVYGTFSIGKNVLRDIRVHSDNYTIEKMDVYLGSDQYYLTGTARDTASGVTVEFAHATADIIQVNPGLLKAIVDNLAKNTAKDLSEHIKLISKEQIEQTAKLITNGQKVSLIINDLTLPEKWVLLRFIDGYQRLEKEDMKRMFAEVNNYYSKFPFKNQEDPFDILNRKKLIKSEDTNVGVTKSELTSLGLKVVTLMAKNKISPFDIINE